MERIEIFRAIEQERERQEKFHPLPKFKKSNNPDITAIENLILHTEFLAVLVEEVGEVARALQGEGDLKEELIQVASVCVRILEQFK
jgi:hypothetical protein